MVGGGGGVGLGGFQTHKRGVIKTQAVAADCFGRSGSGLGLGGGASASTAQLKPP